MALVERLEFLLGLNGQQAITGFKQIRNEAEKSMGGIDNKLLAVGAGMIAFAGVAAIGLNKIAHAAEEAELADTKLLNSIQNSKVILPEAKKQFDDLANSIMRNTVVDDEAVKGAESLLIQFGFTQDQVMSLTPLVVDLSQKMGKDLNSSARAVAMAIEGNASQLQRMGIYVDKARLAIDPLGAVMDALRSKVGGFAEKEAQTFSGRLQQLRNELGEIAEGVGPGVIGVFQMMLAPVKGVADAMMGLSPETQKMIGTVAGVGTVAIGAAGGLTTIAGAALKLRDKLTDVVKVGGESVRTLNTMGKIGLVGGVVAGVVALGFAMRQMTIDNVNKEFQRLIERLHGANGGVAEVIRSLKILMEFSDPNNPRSMFTVPEATKQSHAEFKKLLDKDTEAALVYLGAANEAKINTEGWRLELNQANAERHKAQLLLDFASDAAKRNANASDDLADADVRAAATADLEARALDGLNIMHGAAAELAKKEADAQEALTKQYEDQKRAADAHVQGHFSEIDAYLNLQNAEVSYNKVMHDGKSTMADKKQAIRDLVTARTDYSKAQEAAHGQEMTDAELALITAQNYGIVANTFAPNSDLRKFAKGAADSLHEVGMEAQIPEPVAPDFGKTTEAFNKFAADVRTSMATALPNPAETAFLARRFYETVRAELQQQGPLKVKIVADTDNIIASIQQYLNRGGSLVFRG